MKEISLFSCIFILVLTQVKANSTCIASSEKDKKTKSVNLIREMPPLRDQGETGWCYSFVASDLLTHYLHKTKGKHVQGNNVLATDYQDKDSSVSAVGIAAMYNQNYNKNYTEYLYGLDSKELKKMNKKIVPSGGQIADSIDNVKKYGFCLERDVSSSDLSYKEGQRPMSGNFRILQRLNYIYDSPDCDTCKDYKPIQQVFPGLGLKDISIIVAESSKQNIFTNLINATCYKKFKKNIVSDQPRYFNEYYNNGTSTQKKKLLDSIDKYLDRGIPVGISYYADFLFGSLTSKLPHASSIVGKVYNPKTCEIEYILRNSWGVGCDTYTKGHPKFANCLAEAAKDKGKKDFNNKLFNYKLLNCKNTYKRIPVNPKVRCESPGYLYIQKGELEKNLFGVTAILEDQIF